MEVGDLDAISRDGIANDGLAPSSSGSRSASHGLGARRNLRDVRCAPRRRGHSRGVQIRNDGDGSVTRDQRRLGHLRTEPGTLQYYRDADVRASASRHDLALLFPFHCRSKSDTGGDINVDPRRGLGRMLFAALAQLAERSARRELASAKLIMLGFSGTGSLVARMTEYASDRVIASIPT